MPIYQCINSDCPYPTESRLDYQVRLSKRDGSCPHCRKPLVSVDDILAGRVGNVGRTPHESKKTPKGRHAKRMAFYRRSAQERAVLGRIRSMEKAGIFQGQPSAFQVDGLAG